MVARPGLSALLVAEGLKKPSFFLNPKKSAPLGILDLRWPLAHQYWDVLVNACFMMRPSQIYGVLVSETHPNGSRHRRILLGGMVQRVGNPHFTEILHTVPNVFPPRPRQTHFRHA